MTLQNLKEILLTITDDVHHLDSPKGAEPPYIVWAEDGEADSIWSNNKKRHRVDEGTIDYFTTTEYDATVELIEQTLSDAGVSNKINSIQYDKNTRTMHYEWVWQI